MNHLDLFSGIGGFALAASWVWGEEHNIHSFVEIDPFCQKVLRKHWSDVPIHSDIKEYTVDTHVSLCYEKLSLTEKELIDMGIKQNKYDMAVDLYDSGFSIQNIADFYNITRQAMWMILKRRGCVFRDQLKYGKDNHFYRGGSLRSGRVSDITELAVEKGILINPKKCSVCGEEKAKISGHHDDYNKPLEVRWLCSKCHYEWHKDNKPIKLNTIFPKMSRQEICSRGGSRKEVSHEELVKKIEDATTIDLLTGGFP